MYQCTTMRNYSQFGNFKLWDHICSKNYEKINIKIVITIKQFTPLRNFSHSVELPIMRPNFPKKYLFFSNSLSLLLIGFDISLRKAIDSY